MPVARRDAGPGRTLGRHAAVPVQSRSSHRGIVAGHWHPGRNVMLGHSEINTLCIAWRVPSPALGDRPCRDAGLGRLSDSRRATMVSRSLPVLVENFSKAA